MKYLTLIIAGAALLSACTSEKKNATPAAANATVATEQFTLSTTIAAQAGVAQGHAAMHTFNSVVKANGQLRVLPQSEAEVASPIGANIKQILVVEGQHVSKGQTLAIVGHPDLLELQGRYLSASSRMSYVAKEYQRQKQLYASKIGAGKDFQQITSEYRQLQGELRITAQQLQLLGISPQAVKAGRTVSTIAIKAPIAGSVETISAQTGQYADPQSALFTLVNTDHIYADILVFENHLPQVQPGSTVTLTAKTIEGSMTGTVATVGKMFDTQSRAVHVRVNITSNRNRLIPGTYVTANISGSKVSRLAVPTDAIASDGDRQYVFLAQRKNDQLIFTPREVHTGVSENGFCEITGGLSAAENIASSGAYTLMSEWKKADAAQ